MHRNSGQEVSGSGGPQYHVYVNRRITLAVIAYENGSLSTNTTLRRENVRTLNKRRKKRNYNIFLISPRAAAVNGTMVDRRDDNNGNNNVVDRHEEKKHKNKRNNGSQHRRGWIKDARNKKRKTHFLLMPSSLPPP
jgi:hypothetical protein